MTDLNQKPGRHVRLKFFIEESILPPSDSGVSLVEHISRVTRDGETAKCTDGTMVSLELSSSIDEAQFCILPFKWNKYLESGLTSDVIELARKHSETYFIIQSVGDLEAIIPIRNVIQFQNGLHRSLKRDPDYSFELPAFWPDYLNIYCDGEIQLREKQARPTVGFCGQAASRGHKLAYWTAKNLAHQALYRLGKTVYVPPPIRPSVLLRNEVLSILSNSASIDTKFVIREQYRAGVRNKADRDNYFHPTKVEFVQNIIDSDYTVCVRGGGNFSVRFYETLSLGRIPIFIDTDSRLPYDFIIDWKKHFIWVDQKDIHRLPEIVLDFHSRLSDNDFAALQERCRQIWLQWFFKDGFFRNFCEHLLYVQNIKSEPEKWNMN